MEEMGEGFVARESMKRNSGSEGCPPTAEVESTAPAVAVREPYWWVLPSILGMRSKLKDLGPFEEVKDLIVDNKRLDRVGFLLCSSEGRVCHSSPQLDFFFMHKRAFTLARIRLPFTKFECSVLHSLNIAPSRLHPNS